MQQRLKICTRANEAFEQTGFQTSITLAQISRSKPILNMNRFVHLNPIYIITARRKEERINNAWHIIWSRRWSRRSRANYCEGISHNSRKSPVIAYPKKRKGSKSYAHRIVEVYITPEEKEMLGLVFPMTKDQANLDVNGLKR